MSLRDYWQLTNPNIVSLLAFTALTSGIMGGGLFHPIRLIDMTFACGIASMGARSLTNYVDRDMDAIMDRTKLRPIPRGAIQPLNALAYGLTLSSIGILLAAPVGILYSIILLIGLLDNVVVYNVLTKRRTPWNIILGAPSGGVPAFVAYVSMTGKISIVALMLAALVVLWTPVHIWSLAIRYRDQYEKAHVPMLPVTLGIKPAIKCIASTSILLALFTIALPYIPDTPFGQLTLIVSLILSIPLLYMSLRLLKSTSSELAWNLFKFTSPYLAILFTVMAFDAVFRI
ncbi:MAG: heme o synthase [Conexivisphaerales archaeon]